MKFFSKDKKESMIIIGCGRLGCSLACTISDQNKNVAVTVIDSDENAFKRLPSSYCCSLIVGDGTDTDTLELAGIQDADALIAVTDDDDANIMIAQIAKQHYKIKNVIANVYDTAKEISYNEMNILTVCPTILLANEVERILINAKEEKAV